MLGSFKKSFKNKKKMSPSREILSAIEKEIPSNFMLVNDAEKGLILLPKDGETINGSVTFSDEIMDKLKDIPRDKWITYLYRTQQSISVKNVVVGDDSNKISIALLGQNPFHEIEMVDVKMFPQPFDKPFVIRCETEEGDSLDIKMQQVVYDSWQESKFENVDHKGLKIEFYINDDDLKKSRITYTVSPQKAESVKEAVMDVHLFRGLLNGTAKINGAKTESSKTNGELDKNQVEDLTDFWEKALKLEKKLGVSFNPNADFPGEDVKFFAELVECFINRRSITWRHPFDSFHVNGVVSKEQMENTIGKENLKYTFLEGAIPCTLLGAEFELYSYCELKDFAIRKIDWDDAAEGAEIYVENVNGKDWTMTRFFLTDRERQIVEKMMNEGKHIMIPKDIDNYDKEEKGIVKGKENDE